MRKNALKSGNFTNKTTVPQEIKGCFCYILENTHFKKIYKGEATIWFKNHLNITLTGVAV